MASGANSSGENGNAFPGVDAALRSQQISYLETLLKYKDAKPLVWYRSNRVVETLDVIDDF